MLEYMIKHTKTKGDFIVRCGPREVARFDTEAEAQAWIAEKMTANAQEWEQMQQGAAAQEAYDNGLPDLYQMQLEWQRWRTWFYEEMRHESKRISQARRFLDNAPHPESPTYASHESHLTEDMDDQDRAEALYNDIAIPLDTRIKTARKARDTQALGVALQETVSVIAEMEKFFPHVARPEKRAGGTAPNTSLYLPDDLKNWLRAQGGIQPTLIKLVRQAMAAA